MARERIAPFLIASSLLYFVGTALAYDDKTTHPALTDEIVDFYNLLHPDKPLTSEQKEWIVEGSILEDTNPRWINHFYDPIYKVGWSGEHAGAVEKEKIQEFSRLFIFPSAPVSSLEWLHNDQLQAKYKFYKGTRTWERALLEMIKGNEKEGYKILGHILHLLEDVSVPEHTRNDTHAHEAEGVTGDYGSPFEEYLKKYNRQEIKKLEIVSKLKNEGVAPPAKSAIDEYLISLAEYSNKYFFSKDTIDDQKYKLPLVDKNNCDERICYNEDENSQKFPLVKIKKEATENGVAVSYIIDIGDQQILDAYFSRLSRQAVLYGAGVIEFFQKQVQMKKEYPQHLAVYDPSPFNYFEMPNLSPTSEWIRLRDKTAGFFAEVGAVSRNAFNSAREFFVKIFGDDSGFKEVAQIDLLTQARGSEALPEIGTLQDENPQVPRDAKENKSEPRNSETPEKVPNQSNNQFPADQQQVNLSNENQSVESPAASTITDNSNSTANSASTPPPILKKCSFTTSESPTRDRVIINEVAWMGTTESPANEWIELKNISNSEIDLTNWQLLDKDEQIKISVGLIAKTRVFLLLERTDDSTVPDIAADLIYVGALANENEGLRLFDSQCRLADEVLANPSWPAGDNILKKTMERDRTAFGWHTSYAIGGTPKKENSEPVSGIGSGGGGGGGVMTIAPAPPAPSVSPPTQPLKILISEIQAGVSGAANNEFVEIYNPNDQPIDLTGWALKKKTSSGSESNLLNAASFSGIIPAQGFFLIGHEDYAGSKTKDLSYSNNSNPLAYSNNTILLYDQNSRVVDEINYTDIPQGQSLERKAFQNNNCVSSQGSGEFLGNGCDTDSLSDFEGRASPNPQNKNSLSEPRSSSDTVQNFTIAYSSSTLELIFNWQAPSSSIPSSTFIYKIVDTSAASSTLPNAETASTTMKTAITEINRFYNFSIEPRDQDGLAGTTTTNQIWVANSTDIIAQQMDKSASEQGTGNGQFYERLGSGLLGSPTSVIFHAKFPSVGLGVASAYYFNVTFWQTDNSDYSSSTSVSSNTCYRLGGYGGAIPDGNCPDFGFQFDVDKDYTIPIQQPFIFDPAKFYKLTFFTYQTSAHFYGSTNPNSYVSGEARRDNGGGLEVSGNSLKDLYFILPSVYRIEIPPPISLMAVQSFNVSYDSTSTALVFDWAKPRYFESSTSTLTYRIIDVSNATTTLPNVETTATSTPISINEVGRNYQFSIQALNQAGSSTLVVTGKMIKIPHSLADAFVIAKQTTSTVSEQGTGNGQFFQSLGTGLSGKIGAVTFRANFGSAPRYTGINIYESVTSTYSGATITIDVARCTYAIEYGVLNCPDQPIQSGQRDYTIPAIKNFVFDPTKYYKMELYTYQSQPSFYGSDDASSYLNGQTTKDNGGGAEVAPAGVRDLYFYLLSSVPLI
ncbi:lamin tail domain-containing protein [Candidatus Wolfebacteria bacterium]|nr:lamin tail domain-containing protein [Candidatus Wolfebacteria bacterium]